MLPIVGRAKAVVIKSRVADPYWNLACNTLLHSTMARNGSQTERILFLCRSPPTGFIVLGRHSNQAAEVCVQQAQQARVPIARRLSGGGTHYVAPGNVLFSAMSRGHEATPARPPHNAWIARALQACGLDAHEGDRGRTVCVAGTKVVDSVQEMSPDGQTLQQHGVIVSYTDYVGAQRFLLAGKTKSPRTPLNLPATQVEEALFDAFDPERTATYTECSTATGEGLWEAPDDRRRLGMLYQQLCASNFVHNSNPEFDTMAAHTFAFGHVEIHLEIDTDGLILRARIFSDAADTLFIERLEDALARRRRKRWRPAYRAAELARGLRAYFHLPIVLQNPHAVAQHRLLAEPVAAWLASGVFVPRT
jgi:lipoate-protein ligase A